MIFHDFLKDSFIILLFLLLVYWYYDNYVSYNNSLDIISLNKRIMQIQEWGQ